MRVTYMYHSCFIVELEHHILLFDYFKGELPTFNPNKQVLVFVSHAHHDHFNRAIFHIHHPNILYILSSDIDETKQKAIHIAAHQSVILKDVQIKTLASTDQGVAFFIRVEGINIYHAGDLHWWDWGEEDTSEESKAMELAYKKEMELLQKERIDLAFVVLDPRLKENYAKGIDVFMEISEEAVVFPMHMWDAYDIILLLYKRKESANYQDRIQRIEKAGQSFYFDFGNC